MNALRWGCLAEIDLVVEAKYGNLVAFDELVRRYRSAAMLQAKLVLKSIDLAEDAVQDAFLAAYKSLPTLGEPEAFASWLGTIVRRRAIRLRDGQRVQPLPLDEIILAHTPAIVADLERGDQACMLRQAIAELPEDITASMQLYYLEDWSVSAIANFLGLPQTTVKWRLHTGRTRLRTDLTAKWKETYEPGT